MSLMLSISKLPEGIVATQQDYLFDAVGGSIGRSTSCDWILDDVQRYLSSCHAKILFENNKYFIQDTSTNGLFINGQSEALGKGNKALICDGDSLTLGEYEIRVSLSAALFSSEIPAELPNTDQTDAFDEFLAPVSPEPWEADGPAFDVKSLVMPQELDPMKALDTRQSTASDEFDPSMSGLNDDWLSAPQANAPVLNDAIKLPEPAADPGMIPDDWDDLLAPVKEKPVQVPASNRQAQVVPASQAVAEIAQPQPVAETRQLQRSVATADLESLLALPRPIPESRKDNLEQDISAIIKVSMDGLVKSLSARQVIKNEFRMNITTIQAMENNPLKFSINGEEALDRLFSQSGSAYMQPQQAIEEGFIDIADHQVAMLAGMKKAFSDMLNRFSPENLQQEFDQKGIKQGLLANKQANYWKMYEAHFKSLAEQGDEAFSDDFSSAYEDQLQHMRQLRQDQK